MPDQRGLPTDDEWRDMRHSGFKWGGRVLLYGTLAIVTIMVVGGLVSFAAGWIGGTSEIVSFENFEEQHFQLQQDWESMAATAGNVCSARQVLDDAINRGAPESTVSQRESQFLAHESNYRRIQADYDRRMNNFFETLDGFVAPPELPDIALTLDDQLAQQCPQLADT